ncbi:TonB-dependent receptor plug domain-containing protein [Pseudovibrio brasiliensis]|uniref:TonB-dependent receptor n=1 Tax=Pseudovibrio brasiliensis TaxID=1898042 RepID=A0ABX8AJ40_9HYPH|nr:TonB-dependent receptor [Pseudovibrio brasiliensis]QUS55100.1 TonB-dependent receptor [Pseudovibrio brasiliensis]
MSKGFVSGLMTGICYLALQSGAYSQEQKEPEELGPIVVTAARGEQSLDEVTRSVAVVDSEQIERAVADSVTEVLRDVPGIKIVDSGTQGMKRISIRGEAAIRNVVLIDGQEISDHSSYGPLFLIAPEDIERIEVVKGPGSVLHGSKAIGGVVNIITKKGADRPVEVEVGTSFDSSNDGFTAFTAVSGTVDSWDYRVSGRKAKANDLKTPSGDLEPSGSDDQSLTAYLGYNGDSHKFSIKAERYELESDLYSETPIMAFDFPKRDRTKIGFFYDYSDVNENISNLHLDGYFQQIERIAVNNLFIGFPTEKNNEIDSTLQTLGLNGQADLLLLDDHLTKVGFQIINDNLDKTTDSRSSFPFPSKLEADESDLTTMSAFAQDEWDITEDLTLTGGGRYYFVKRKNKGASGNIDDNDQAFVGALGINYTGLKNVSLRAHLGQGYVYPTLVQNTLGSIFTPANVIHGNLDLKPEKSVTAEVGARYDDGVFTLDVGAYYTDAKDYITSVKCDLGNSVHANICDTTDDYLYVNINSAKTWGLEIAGSYKIAEYALTPYANLTLMRRQFKTPESTTFHTDTPLVSGRLGVTKDWSFSNGVEAFADLYTRFSSKHTDLEGNDVDEEAGYATLNLAGGFSYDYDEERKLRVNAAIENIFDKEYKPSLSELTAAGRTFKLSASVIF